MDPADGVAVLEVIDAARRQRGGASRGGPVDSVAAMADDATRKNLEAELDEVYRGDPAQLRRRRRELAKRCRAAGEQELADEVAALRKPTRGAWAINQLDAAIRDRLLEAGERPALRTGAPGGR